MLQPCTQFQCVNAPIRAPIFHSRLWHLVQLPKRKASKQAEKEEEKMINFRDMRDVMLKSYSWRWEKPSCSQLAERRFSQCRDTLQVNDDRHSWGSWVHPRMCHSSGIVRSLLWISDFHHLASMLFLHEKKQPSDTFIGLISVMYVQERLGLTRMWIATGNTVEWSVLTLDYRDIFGWLCIEYIRWNCERKTIQFNREQQRGRD